MSFIHNQSCECASSQLDLFTLPPTQTSIERSEVVEYKPIASLADDIPIEFVVPGNGDEYIDLQGTQLLVVVKVTNNEGDALLNTDDVAPINNWLHSLFSQVDVSVNQKTISHANHMYPYRAYIENLLTYNQTAKESHLTQVLWYKDDAGKFDSNLDTNSGYKERKDFIKNSKRVAMIGRIHADVFGIDKYLINGAELRIKLTKSKSSFNLQSPAVNADFKVKILEATLLVRKVGLSPTVKIAHSRALEHATAKYPITRVELKSVTLSRDLMDKGLNNLYLGQMPSRLIVGFVSNSALNGDYAKNPFNFKHFNLNFFSIYLDGRQVPGKPLQPCFDAGNEMYIQAYNSLFDGTGIKYSDDGNCISRTEYKDGYTLLAFDLTPDQSASSSHWSLQKQGSVRIDVKFSSALTETVSCVIYAEFKNIMEIDLYRNVMVDFS